MISAVLFDLDDTLHDRARSLRSFAIEQHGRLFADRVDQGTFVSRFVQLDAHGSLSKAILYPLLLAEFGIENSMSDELAAEYGERFHEHAKPMEGALDLLRTLRASGIKLGVVSNGWTNFQHRTIDAIGIRDAVDVILISQAESLRKPDVELFRRAASKLGTKPNECLFVGDNPEADILGAEAAGMRAIWLRRGMAWPTGYPNQANCIDALGEVLCHAGGQDLTSE